MAQHKARALVLGAFDYRETSRILQLFSEEDGLVSLVARGLRSPKSRHANAAEKFNLVQVTFTAKEGASMGTLSGIEVERQFGGIRENIDAYALANYWFEVVGVAVQPGMQAPALFRLTIDFLGLLCYPACIGAPVLQAFGSLLDALGIGVHATVCSSCGARDEVTHFDTSEGVAYCAHCASPNKRQFPLSACLKECFAGAGAGMAVISKADLFAGLCLVNDVASYHLDHSMKSFGFLCDVLGGHKK